MKTSIFETLEKLHLTSVETRTLFNNRTRDVDDVKVWRDDVSGVIYIDGFYTGNQTYVDGSYRENKQLSLQAVKLDYEQATDAKRRF
jgi:hypothetical protein